MNSSGRDLRASVAVIGDFWVADGLRAQGHEVVCPLDICVEAVRRAVERADIVICCTDDARVLTTIAGAANGGQIVLCTTGRACATRLRGLLNDPSVTVGVTSGPLTDGGHGLRFRAIPHTRTSDALSRLRRVLPRLAA